MFCVRVRVSMSPMNSHVPVSSRVQEVILMIHATTVRSTARHSCVGSCIWADIRLLYTRDTVCVGVCMLWFMNQANTFWQVSLRPPQQPSCRDVNIAKGTLSHLLFWSPCHPMLLVLSQVTYCPLSSFNAKWQLSCHVNTPLPPPLGREKRYILAVTHTF